MTINEQDVHHVAKLAKLSFKDNEIAHFTEQLCDIMDMVEQLNEVDTSNVEVTTQGYPIYNVTRLDIPEQGMERDLLFRNVKSEKYGFIKVPAMLEGGEE